MDVVLSLIVKLLGRILNICPFSLKFAPNKAKHDLSRLEIVVSNEWDRYQLKLLKELSDLNNYNQFLRLPTVRSTMHPQMYWIAFKYQIYLSKSPLFSLFRKLFKEPRIGNPIRQPTLLTCSPINIQHIFHLHEIVKHAEIKISEFDKILEFGGGYGNLCRLIHLMGFQGQYWIKDIPVSQILQKYYLCDTLPKRISSEIKLVEEFPPCSDLTGDYLYIATWSLSETTLDLRQKQEKYLQSAKVFYITFVKQWYGTELDNLEYFSQLSASLQATHDVKVFESEIFVNNFTFIGVKR